MSGAGYTRGEPFIEYRAREPIHPRRVRVYLLLPNGERHAPVIEDSPELDAHIAEIARALRERDRRVKGRRVGGPPPAGSAS